MTGKLTKLTENWLLCETTRRRGLISVRHIDEIWTNITDENVTELFLTGERGPIHVEVPIDDVLAIVTGPPKRIDKPTDREGGV